MSEKKIPWTLPVSQVNLYETLEHRVSKPFEIPLKEIFIVCPAGKNPRTGSWEEFECEYTLLPDARFPVLNQMLPYDIKVFFVKDAKGTKILWTKKFNYPRISTVKSNRIILPPGIN